MIAPHPPELSILRQCALLGLSRLAFYSPSRSEPPLNLALMKLVDARFMETPFYGSRHMARHLRNQGYCLWRKRVRRLMARMDLRAVYQKPRTSRPHPSKRKYRYLFLDLPGARPDHVWCVEITYILMQRGFRYLLAIMDRATRRVLSWRLSNAMDVEFCIEALEETATAWKARDIHHGLKPSVHKPTLHGDPRRRNFEDIGGRARQMDG
ncbi:IS3 family transposase [Thioclava kandeliae]|uniref:IS3 family transposase n=1 Tax=Thioclava kandeliae TaxID=3070818 RepID=A0ABV1SL16_9RHOB